MRHRFIRTGKVMEQFESSDVGSQLFIDEYMLLSFSIGFFNP